jgi:hypothetical protein
MDDDSVIKAFSSAQALAVLNKITFFYNCLNAGKPEMGYFFLGGLSEQLKNIYQDGQAPSNPTQPVQPVVPVNPGDGQ